ncbi:serine threonine- kinase sgk2 protein [Rutstroemia sp. NJR-2017a WRK4]|nr:serine threonine- kinase sgk2 protein [Rutstroemia sp. NJR-2017a WRK4]
MLFEVIGCSLLEDGRILHRDISENHIIIAEPDVEGAPKVELAISLARCS